MTELDKKIRAEFPLLAKTDLAYLDNGATTQKPQCVLDAVRHYYEEENANPMRGLYELSLRATEAYESARARTASFIGAQDETQIIFTRNATESLNLVAYSYGEAFLSEGDEMIVGIGEHHSNFLPWQQLGKRTGANILYFECSEDGYYDPEKLREILSARTKLVAITQVSNVFGRINDIKTFAQLAHEAGAVIVVDGAQSVPHTPVDVTDLDVDFFAFSGHKMYAPMGIGVLYGKKELLEKMPPFLYGGEMIEIVTTKRATFAEVPHKFEAGTVNAGGAVGLAEAIRFMERYGFDVIQEREEHLTHLAFEGMQRIPHIHIIGSDRWSDHHGILSFQVEGVHPHDVAAIFSEHKIAIRAGHHCAQPLHKHIGIPSSTRLSLAFYNTEEEIERFLQVLAGIRAQMGY